MPQGVLTIHQDCPTTPSAQVQHYSSAQMCPCTLPNQTQVTTVIISSCSKFHNYTDRLSSSALKNLCCVIGRCSRSKAGHKMFDALLMHLLMQHAQKHLHLDPQENCMDIYLRVTSLGAPVFAIMHIIQLWAVVVCVKKRGKLVAFRERTGPCAVHVQIYFLIWFAQLCLQSFSIWPVPECNVLLIFYTSRLFTYKITSHWTKNHDCAADPDATGRMM